MRHTILFADNDPTIRRFCQQELEAAGYRAVIAEDGEVAISIANSFAVDLVILDQHMLRCSGLETARHFKRLFPRLPVILFSADESYENYQCPAIDAAVTKSEDLTKLMATIADLLEGTLREPAPAGAPSKQLASSTGAN